MYSLMKEPSLLKKILFMFGMNSPEVKAYKESKTSSSLLKDKNFRKEVKDKYLSGIYAKNRMNKHYCYMEINQEVYTFLEEDLKNL